MKCMLQVSDQTINLSGMLGDITCLLRHTAWCVLTGVNLLGDGNIVCGLQCDENLRVYHFYRGQNSVS
jgi:hypothetical protein